MISAVLTSCSARKQELSSPALNASEQAVGPQAAVAEQWLAKLAAAPALIPARDLYIGTSFKRVRHAAERVGCSLFIMSAGLGLLEGGTRVPRYDLTLSPFATACIQSLVTDNFDPALWWRQMQRGPFASAIEVIAGGEGRILVALTKPYAQMIGAALTQLPEAAQSRLRIFGAGLNSSLATSLHSQVMPYDARLDVIVPGTRLDFASRALVHFADLLSLQPGGDAREDADRVRAVLAPVEVPETGKRLKLADAELSGHVKVLVQRGLSRTSALRELREGMGLACEHARFARLYRSVCP